MRVHISLYYPRVYNLKGLRSPPPDSPPPPGQEEFRIRFLATHPSGKETTSGFLSWKHPVLPRRPGRLPNFPSNQPEQKPPFGMYSLTVSRVLHFPLYFPPIHLCNFFRSMGTTSSRMTQNLGRARSKGKTSEKSG